MLDGESGVKRATDLVLCEASTVRLIAEIKFEPYPKWEPDIQKLNAIAQLDSKGHKFLIEPASGRFSGARLLKIHITACAGFAGVLASPSSWPPAVRTVSRRA